MTPSGLVSMRKAAALAFAIPGLEVDIANGGDLIARVERRFEGTNVPLGTTLLSPCAFRAAVGKATVHARNGGRALFLGLGPDAEVQMHYFMPFTGAANPLGMIVSRVGETIVHVFATELDADRALAIIRETPLHPALPVDDPSQIAVNVSWDDVADVTLVYCETRITTLATVRPHVEALMHSLLVQTGVAEIVACVESSTARSAG